jgi:murein DD-endopeptidase MepM/ murein hydrolase activator NlpD
MPLGAPISRQFAALLAALATAPVPEAGAAPVAGAQEPPTAVPGAVVRWPGAELSDCSIGERHWAPLDGACWYPIDLEAQGELELVRRSSGGVASRSVKIGSYPYATEELTVEEKYVAPPKAALERIEREKARVAKLWVLATPRRFALPLSAPLAALPTAGRFGSRRVFNKEPRSPHSGADFSAKAGTTVFAPADGTVALAEEQYFAGNAVYLDHGDGLISMAFHLSEIGVANGDEVKRGQPIGKVGATGRVTGPHLHFALRWHGARVDPDLLLGRAEPVEIR